MVEGGTCEGALGVEARVRRVTGWVGSKWKWKKTGYGRGCQGGVGELSNRKIRNKKK